MVLTEIRKKGLRAYHLFFYLKRSKIHHSEIQSHIVAHYLTLFLPPPPPPPPPPTSRIVYSK